MTDRAVVAVGIIPARWGSTRFPGKALAETGAGPLIRLVHDAARAARSLARVVVATDDERIAAAVRSFGGEAAMTSGAHRSGSDRAAEAAGRIDCDVVVNIQGDEPLIGAAAIDAAVEALRREPALGAATLATPLEDDAAADDPHTVKVVTDAAGNALYFSRAAIPWGGGARRLKHIGLYAFRKEFLLRFTRWPATPLEEAERLEQLRILERGERIRVVETPFDSVGVDTPEDLDRVRAIIAAGRRGEAGT
ncbi:MAG: 3-deoxy-manno-octulosonate cytidylyltransferase [bacterium]|nr:3-deoxy-manno-octulosonate cytidylyltransferase [bacterium]